MTGPLADDLVALILALDDGLSAAGLPYAFGGAIALGYATGEPRMTRDVDLNVFIPASRAAEALAALPSALTWSDEQQSEIEATGQARIENGVFPVDLFLMNLELHVEAGRRVRQVPFADRTIPVLSAIDIVTFKALFDRTKDWADIEAVLAARAISVSDAVNAIAALVGTDDRRVVRLRAAAANVDSPHRFDPD